jgi:hypothetical protein
VDLPSRRALFCKSKYAHPERLLRVGPFIEELLMF